MGAALLKVGAARIVRYRPWAPVVQGNSRHTTCKKRGV